MVGGKEDSVKKLFETITAENWGKGIGHFPPITGRECLLTLLAKRNLGGTSKEYGRLSEAIGLLYPDRAGKGRLLHVFNDHPDTTLEDMLRVCKVADV